MTAKVLKFKRRDVTPLLDRPRQIADDEAASRAPGHSKTARQKATTDGSAFGFIKFSKSFM
jgi:hypothetical protein